MKGDGEESRETRDLYYTATRRGIRADAHFSAFTSIAPFLGQWVTSKRNWASDIGLIIVSAKQLILKPRGQHARTNTSRLF